MGSEEIHNSFKPNWERKHKHPLKKCCFHFCVKKTKTTTEQSTTKSWARERKMGFWGWGAGGGLGLPRMSAPATRPLQVLLTSIRPRQVRVSQGKGRRRSAARRQCAPFGRQRPRPQRSPSSGAPAGRMGGLPQRASSRTRTSGPPPRRQPLASGFDKLNLRTLEKLQEEGERRMCRVAGESPVPAESCRRSARAGPAPAERAPGPIEGPGEDGPPPRLPGRPPPIGGRR